MTPTTKDNLRPLQGSHSICYFLGAGFSAQSNYRLPTAVGFLSREAPVYSHDWRGQKGSICASEREDLLQLLLRLEARYGELGLLNLETVMSDLYERTAGIGQPWGDRDAAYVDQVLPFENPGLRPVAPRGIRLAPRPEGSDLRRDYELLLLYIALRLRTVEVAPDECPMARRFLDTLRLRDSIITLNYDTIIERQWTRSPEYRTLPDERVDLLGNYIGAPACGHQTGPAMLDDVQPGARGFFAKLHGSVDWRSCPDPMCPNHKHIASTSRRRPGTLNGAEQRNCAACGSVVQPVIIPPVATKPFERFPKLRLMWLQAFRALRLAPRWVFIGVSFAPTDTQLRSLVRAASEDWVPTGIADLGQICVVNIDNQARREEGDQLRERAVDRLRQCLSPRAQQKLTTEVGGITTFASVDDYLAAVQCTDDSRDPDPMR